MMALSNLFFLLCYVLVVDGFTSLKRAATTATANNHNPFQTLQLRRTQIRSSISEDSFDKKSTQATFINAVSQFFSNLANSMIPSKESSKTKKLVKSKIAIVGAGISGLAAANELLRLGEKDFVIIEASDDVGGRVRSDLVDGFILDRGFQVFIEAYPKSREVLAYQQLELRPFLPGAIVRLDNSFHLVSDPIRRPQDLLATLISPVGSIADKIKVGYYYLTYSNLDGTIKTRVST